MGKGEGGGEGGGVAWEGPDGGVPWTIMYILVHPRHNIVAAGIQSSILQYPNG